MADIEKHKQQPANPEAKEALEHPHALRTQTDAIRRLLGVELPDVPNPFGAFDKAEASAKLAKEIVSLRKNAKDNRAVYMSFREMCRENVLEFSTRALELVSQKDRRPDARVEMSVAEKGRTYSEYLPAIIGQLVGVMDACEEQFNELLPSLAPAERKMLEQDRRQMVLYLQEVRKAMETRVRFANIMLLEEKSRNNAPDLMDQEKEDARALIQAIKKSMSPEARAFFENEEKQIAEVGKIDPVKNRDAYWAKVAEIRAARSAFVLEAEKNLIAILKGNPDGLPIEGAPKEFLPQKVQINMLRVRSQQINELQGSIARNKNISETERKVIQGQLMEEHRALMDEMISVTRMLGGHQLAMAELTSIQNQFGNEFDLDGAKPPLNMQTRPSSLTEIEKRIDGAKDFHLDTLQKMLKEVDTSFNPNGLKNLKDSFDMELLGGVNWLSSGIRKMITVGLPEGTMKTAISEFVDSQLPLALQESLESGVGPDGKPMTVKEKMEKIRDVILRFRNTGTVDRLKSTVSLVQSLPPASNFVGEQVQEDVVAALANERFTESPLGKTVKVNGADVVVTGPTAYALLLRQMHTDGDSFFSAYETFLGEMEDFTGKRVALIAEVNMIKEAWFKVLATIAGGTAMAWVLPAAGGITGAYILKKGASTALRLPRKMGSLTKRAYDAIKSAPVEKLSNAEARAVANEMKLGEKVNRTALGMSAAVQIWRTYEDWKEIGNIAERNNEIKGRMRAELLGAGFQQVGDDQDHLAYSDRGVTITVRLNQLSGELNEKEYAQMAKTTVSAGQALYLLRAAWKAKSAMSATGAMIAADIAIDTVVYGVNQDAIRDFVAKCPAWLLPKIGLEESIDDSAYGLLATSSETMLTDVPFGDNADKPGIRKKMLFAMLESELAEFPDLANDVHPGSSHPRELEKFYNGDFQSVVLPLYAKCLEKLAGGALSNEEIAEGKVGHDGLFSRFGGRTPEIREMHVRTALREAMVLYTQHLHQKEYLDAKAAYEAMVAKGNEKPEVLGYMAELVESLGERTVFGVMAKDMPGSAGETKITSFIKQPDGSIDLSNPEKVYASVITDPAVRMKIGSIVPRTLDEKYNAEGKEWHEPAYYREIFRTPEEITNGSEMLRNIDFSLTLGAMDNIRLELGRPELTKPNTVASYVLGTAVDGQISKEKAEQQITEDARDLFEADAKKAIEYRSAFVKRETTKAGVPVYVTGSIGDGLFSRLHWEPQIPASVGNVKLQAIFIEGKSLLKSGAEAALATYVYGDIDKGEIFVVQRGAATAALANATGNGERGMLIPVPLSSLQKKPGFDKMIGIIRAANEATRKGNEEYARSAPERQSQREEEYAWLLQMRNDAIAYAKAHPRTYFHIPSVGVLSDANGKQFPSLPDELWCFLPDGSLLKRPFNTGSSVSARKEIKSGIQTAVHNTEGNAFSFSRFPASGEGAYWTLKGNSFRGQQDLDAPTKEYMLNALTTPIQGYDIMSVQNVLDAFNYEIDIPGAIRSAFGATSRYYKNELNDAVLPLYQNSKKKPEFLRALFESIEKHGITSDGVPKIIEEMKLQN